MHVTQEVTPVQVAGKPGTAGGPVMTDEALMKVKPDKLRNLPAAFVKEGGTVTAGNSSIIADGAAALVLVSAERASELGLRVCCWLLMRLMMIGLIYMVTPLLPAATVHPAQAKALPHAETLALGWLICH